MQYRLTSIKSKMIGIFITFIVVLLTINYFYYINSLNIEKTYKSQTTMIYLCTDLAEKNTEMNLALQNFVATKNTKYIDLANNYQTEFKETMGKLKKKKLSLEAELYLKNIENVFETSYLPITNDAIWAIRGINPDLAPDFYNESILIKDYINDYISMMITNQISLSQENTRLIDSEIKQMHRNNLLISVISSLIVWMAVYFLGWNMVKNISILTKSAEAVAGGDFETKVNLVSDDELSLFANIFNKLISNTKDLINKIQENANLEVKLHKKEAMLREVELKSLQAQINPHFLFNTLNIIAKTAIIEDAEETCDLIENAADMFRYNLRKIDQVATIREEIENVKNYLFIQKTRFGERVAFDIDVPKHLESIEIPYLTIQPLVENAFIHGIEKKEEGGSILVQGAEDEEGAYLLVSDNGLGISEERLAEILSDSGVSGHTTGIGLDNVMRRLSIFFNREDVLQIRSQVNQGTTIMVRLGYVSEEVESHV